MDDRAAHRSWISRRLVAFVAAVALVAVPGAAAAQSDAAPVSGDGDERLLVTYAAPVAGDVEAAAFSTASVVADADIDVSAVQVLSFDSPRDRADAARALAARPDVLSVEPDQWVRPDTEVHEVVALPAADGFTTASTSGPSSWGVVNDGRSINGTPGRAGVDVGGATAIKHATGRGVVVAVIDSGVDITHPALTGRIWTNPKETADGRDSDGNGYVDDVNGWNFARNTNRLFDDATLDSHGTHVAGIIVGTAQSQVGFRPVAPDAKVMPLKFIDGEAGRLSDAIAAIRYAYDNGADLINASWGGEQPSSALRQVLAETPIPVVISAGNLGAALEDKPSYPASFGLDTTIAVAAHTNDAKLADFSSYSRDLVDVAAPGAHILGPWPNSRMAIASGSSQAAPHVSGVVALALQRHPDLSPVEVATAVRATVRPLSGVARTTSGGIVRAPALLDHLGTRVPACAPGTTTAFTDISATSPHRDSIACLVSLGITKGMTADTFGSADGLTRAQIASLVGRAFTEVGAMPPVPATGRFADVPATSVHRDNIEALGAVGVVRGDTATSYAPHRTATRAELAAIVARAAEYLAQGEVRVRGTGFADTVGVPDELEIDKSAGLRIVMGRLDGRFEPDAPVRRDQAASMVNRLLERWVQQGLLNAA